MTTTTDTNDGILRRTVLKASAVAAGALAVSTPGAAGGGEEETDDGTGDTDEPEGFEVEILAEHASFPDDLAATFDFAFGDTDDTDDTDDDASDDFVEIDFDDASTAIFAEVTWTEGGTSGWHRHPGVAIVNLVEGEIEVTWETDCVPRTYGAGEALFDPGEIHVADSEDGAFGYVLFLGVPDGEPATEWVEPVDC